VTRLRWAVPGSRRYETGVDHGVLYPINEPGVAWSGLISVTESPTGGDPNPFYMDGIKYQNRARPEEYAATLEAYTYPPQFAKCDGTVALVPGLYVAHQRRRPFHLSYRTLIGTDVKHDYGYRIHLVYNVLASPSERNNTTLGEDPEAITFKWSLSTTPMSILGAKPTAHIILDSNELEPAILMMLEDKLYGSDSDQPSMPSLEELKAILLDNQPEEPFTVTLLGNGVFQVSGSDRAVKMVDPNHFQLSSQYVIDHLDGSYVATTGIEEDPDGPTIPFTVEDLGNGVVKYTGPDSMVNLTDTNHFMLSGPTVIDNDDGSFTASSA
jgi:hypothetical protein